MSSIGYDEALLAKIRGWVRDDTLKIISPSDIKQTFAIKADIENDKPLQLPFIVIRRLSPIKILEITKKPLTFDGYRDTINSDKGNQLNGIPIELDYQIDIYTRTFDESDEYVRNFVFNIINFPNLQIEIPYNNSNFKHMSHIRLSPDIEDNSDIPERLIQGQFTRRTISINVDDAYLFDYRTKDTIKIGDLNVEVKLKSEDDD